MEVGTAIEMSKKYLCTELIEIAAEESWWKPCLVQVSTRLTVEGSVGVTPV